MIIVNHWKAEFIIMNAAKFTRQHTVVHVAHVKCGSLLVNVTELVCILERNG